MTYAGGSADVHVTGRRVLATFVDAIVFGVVSAILTEVSGTRTTQSSLDFTRLSTGGSFLLFAVVVLYYVLMEGLLGRTIGKMVAGIRVVDAASGNRPGIGKAIIRTLLRIIDGIGAYLIAFVVVISSDRRRRLGDMAAKTLVVRA
jgi:uncharacterized RDD family membrane protein YckC